MGRRMLRTMSVIAIGCSFQIIGCESEQIGEIVAASIRSTAVEVSTFVVESIVDDALGLE